MIRSSITKILFIINYSLLIILSSCSVSKQIGKQANTILLKDTAISTGHIGICIYEPATNKYWYGYDDTHYFIPASNTKLFTLYAGMKYLGDSLVGLRYKTYNIPSDTITEITATGDPSFLLNEFKYQPVLDFLKSQKKIAINELQYLNPLGMGWAWDDYQETYMAPRSTFPMYGDVVKVKWNNKDSVPIFPKYFHKESENLNFLDSGFNLTRKWGSNSLIFTPGTNKNSATTFESDLLTQIKLLEDTLPDLDIFVNYQPLQHFPKHFPKPITRDSVSLSDQKYMNEFLSYREYKNHYFDLKNNTIHSQPTDSLFKPMMHRSDNFFAEQTLLMASNEHLGYMNDEKIIDTILKTDLKDIPQRPKWVDGSGLSRYNLFSPEDFIFLLNKMREDFSWNRITTILPTGGTGTISNYYKNLKGRIFVKTGTLSNNVALSGYLITKKNKTLIFSVLVNNHISSVNDIRKDIEAFLTTIAE